MIQTAAADAEGCLLYLINKSLDEPESVWVSEVWRSRKDYDASLLPEQAQAEIKEVLPLLAAPVSISRIDLLPVGGKGVALP